VTIYKYDPTTISWAQVQDPITNHDCFLQFGSSVEIVAESNGLVIECGNGQNMAGVVYYYTQDSDSDEYKLRQTITAPDGSMEDAVNFATRIVVDGKIMVVTNPGANAGEGGEAFVYALVEGFWMESAVIRDPSGYGGFGKNADMSGHNLLISSNGYAHHYKVETGSLLSSNPSVSLFPSSSPRSPPSKIPSASQNPSRRPSSSTLPTESCTFIELDIVFDQYPSETSWEISKMISVIESEVRFNFTAESLLYPYHACLQEGIYQFKILDTYGDGICCTLGDGGYNLTIGDKVIAQGGNFGEAEMTTFHIPFDPTKVNTTTISSSPVPETSFTPMPSPMIPL